jgi:hypothetical protein
MFSTMLMTIAVPFYTRIKLKSVPAMANTVIFYFIISFIAGCSSFQKTDNQRRQESIKASFIPGQRLPGTWRPFSDDSPWNTVVSDAQVHENSEAIMSRMNSASKNIRFGNYYIIPLWVVNIDRMSLYQARAFHPKGRDSHVTRAQVFVK